MLFFIYGIKSYAFVCRAMISRTPAHNSSGSCSLSVCFTIYNMCQTIGLYRTFFRMESATHCERYQMLPANMVIFVVGFLFCCQIATSADAAIFALIERNLSEVN